MFLSENYYGESISADPMCGMNIIQEAEDAYTDLCMKMIKLEHHAIMSEDANLLEAGLEDWKDKVKLVAKRAYEKFMEYLERVRVEWTKIQATIQTKIANPAMISQLIKNCAKLQGQKFMCNASALAKGNELLTYFNICNVDKATDGSYIKKLSNLSSEIENAQPNEYPLTPQLVKNACNFLKDRAHAVKNIQKFKSEATKAYKEDLKNIEKDEKSEAKLKITQFQRMCNKLIINVNKITSAAVKICNAARRNASSKELSNAKKAKKGIYTGVEPKGVQSASASILDMYD